MTENPNFPPALDESLLMELQSISRKLSSLDEDVNRIDRDLSTDRKDIEKLKIDMATIQASLNGIMAILTRFQVKTKDAVMDAVTEANAPMAKQMKQFVNKKVLRVHIPAEGLITKIKAWWSKINS